MSKESNLFPRDLLIHKRNDVIDGEHIILKYKDGTTFGSTTQNTKQEVFYTQTKKERDLICEIGKSDFVKLLNEHYQLNVKSVL